MKSTQPLFKEVLDRDDLRVVWRQSTVEGVVYGGGFQVHEPVARIQANGGVMVAELVIGSQENRRGEPPYRWDTVGVRNDQAVQGRRDDRRAGTDLAAHCVGRTANVDDLDPVVGAQALDPLAAPMGEVRNQTDVRDAG